MEDMEQTLKDISDQNTTLKQSCCTLESEKDELHSRNTELEQQIAELTKRLQEKDAVIAEAKSQLAERNVGCGTNIHGSAESNKPLPQELEPQSTIHSVEKEQLATDNNDSIALWKIIALCLLYRTCSKTSTHLDWKSLPKLCSQMPSQSWQKILLQAASQLPKLKAPQSECLDQWWGPKQSSWNPPKIPMKC